MKHIKVQLLNLLKIDLFKVKQFTITKRWFSADPSGRAV
jgi:hypothetical protein